MKRNRLFLSAILLTGMTTQSALIARPSKQAPAASAAKAPATAHSKGSTAPKPADKASPKNFAPVRKETTARGHFEPERKAGGFQTNKGGGPDPVKSRVQDGRGHENHSGAIYTRGNAEGHKQIPVDRPEQLFAHDRDKHEDRREHAERRDAREDRREHDAREDRREHEAREDRRERDAREDRREHEAREHRYSERTYSYHDHEFFHRTYYVHGVAYSRFYQPYYYRGISFHVYAPGFYYAPAFYGWAYSPWAAPVAFNWGWAGAPWYGYYGAWFRPYPVYASPSMWLTDYLVAQTLETAYEQRTAELAAERRRLEAASFAATPITPDVKQAIAGEVRRQIALENSESRTAGVNPPDPGSSGLARMLSDHTAHVFVVANSLSVASSVGACTLSDGDVIQLNGATAPDATSANLVVLASKGAECRKGSLVTVGLADLQEMQNHMRATIDQGLAELQSKQGSNGLPTAPATALKPPTQTQYAAIAPPASN